MIKKIKILLLVVFSLVVTPKCFAQTKIALNDINRLRFGSAVLKDNNYYIPARSLFLITNASCIWEPDQKVVLSRVSCFESNIHLIAILLLIVENYFFHT